uniref:BHLH domain-containing protein n=1 Tax=Oryza punctata TaxID=4537 RepID=A0A0E0K0X6_ORYPU
MSRDQRHGRQLPLATSGITFNGVPLSPLTPAAAAAVESDDDDVVIIDACNGKRKVGDGEEGRGSQGDDDDVAAVHGGGGGDQACMFAERERDRRRRMNDMFAGIRRLVPNLPEKVRSRPAAGARAAPPPSLKTWSWGDNVVVSVLGNIGNMTVRAPLRKAGVLAMASAALKRYNITAVTSLSGTDPSQTQNMFMFYTIIDMPDRQPQFVHPKVYEAMYRAAAAEIAAWINCY